MIKRYKALGVIALMAVTTLLPAVVAEAREIPPWGFGASHRPHTIHVDERASSAGAGNTGMASDNINNAHIIQTMGAGFFGGGYNHFHIAHGVDQSPYNEGDYIGTLTIHRLGNVVRVFEGETMRNMDFGGGRFTFTGLNHGNVGIIGHNRGPVGFFSFVRLLREGDIITFETATGARQYKVTMSHIVHETDFSPLYDHGDNRLTLVTCVEYRQRYRRISVAVRI